MKEDIKTEAKQQLDHAWLLAQRMRCCPPDDILFGDVEKDKALEDHLQDCQSCRQARLDFPDGINMQLPKIKNKKNSLSPGELWSISPDMRGWGEKNRYYNPPVVLITADAGGYGFTVVQTYCNMLLAGKDDIALNGEANELTGFAQPWNRYTLHRKNLGIYLGRVSEPCLQEVILALDNEPEEVKPGSLLWFFRHMEVETGWYFSQQAFPVLMDAYERWTRAGY